MGLTARARPTTRTAISGATAAGLTRSADAVATVGAAHTFTTAERLDFRSAGVVPGRFTTVGIELADTRLNGSIGAAQAAVGSAAIPGTRAIATIHGAIATAFVHSTRPVATAGGISTLAATKVHHLLRANRIPLRLAAERILLADALGDDCVFATRGAVGSATVTGTRPAVPRTALAVLTVGTEKIAAGRRTIADAAAKLADFGDTGLVPGVLAAKCVLGADASHQRRVVTPRRPVDLAAISRVVTGSAILGASAAGFPVVALAVAARRPSTAGAATVLCDFGHTGIVPQRVAAEHILRTDTGDHGWIVTTRRAIGLATVAGVVAGTAVLNAIATSFSAIADPVATDWDGRTVAAAIGRHLTHTLSVPSGAAAEGILPADARGDGCIVATRRAIRLTTVPGEAAAPAAKLLHFANTLRVPLISAAPGVEIANAGLHPGIVTARRTLGNATGGNGKCRGGGQQRQGNSQGNKQTVHRSSFREAAREGPSRWPK